MSETALFKIFLGDSSDRPWMLKPNEQDGFVYATNANCLIRIPKDKCVHVYPAHEKTANFNPVMESVIATEPVVIAKDFLKFIIDQFELINDTSECPDCDGEGQQGCDLGHYHDCENCNGDGEIINYGLPKVLPKKDVAVKIGEVYISPFYLNKLLQVMDILSLNEVIQVGGRNISHKGQMFKAGDCDIILMPLSMSEEDLEDFKIIEAELKLCTN